MSSIHPYWYIDFEGYQFNDTFYIKEIAILSSDVSQCYNYFVHSPKFLHSATTRHQYHQHNLRWDFGEHSFHDVINGINKKVGNDMLFIKGEQKMKFLEQWLPNITDATWLPSFKNMNQCLHEVCDMKHGKMCARRKVFEMLYHDKI